MQSEIKNLWSDQDLLKAIKKEDRAAFEIIYNKYWSRLYLSAYNILRDKQRSEDIIQEIFVHLWLKRSTSNIENLNGYLYSAVRYQVFKAIRDGKVRTGLSEQLKMINSHCAIESILIEKDINKRLDESIALLPRKCKEIFILSRKEHLTASQISSRLNLSQKTIENQLTIALRRIRENMGDLLFWAAITLFNLWNK